MSEDTQSREGNCQIASFDLTLPQIVRIDCRRNQEDELNGIWQSWDEVKKTCFRDNYGPLADQMGLPIDTMKARSKDKNGPCISCSTCYGKGQWCLYKHFRHVFVPLTKPIEEFLESEWPPNQLIEDRVQNLSTLTYQEIEWRTPWMIQSMVLIGCCVHLWVPLIGIWGAISYSLLMVLSQYGYDQCVPTIAGLNRVEALV
ncbi:hypothetical protein Gogos_019804 [Gossypium gossypioides]|uniref:DUF7745 domain-containing protein n=1 Tax=Gossypium gossypioides TaxID=34282 RepID=A0A7J9CZL2_GOSGO|nr:hypothetical protein [Gossypium gossypioides]